MTVYRESGGGLLRCRQGYYIEACAGEKSNGAETHGIHTVGRSGTATLRRSVEPKTLLRSVAKRFHFSITGTSFSDFKSINGFAYNFDTERIVNRCDPADSSTSPTFAVL